MCLLIGLTGTVVLTFLTPPFEVPDEPQHFFRAYQLSELEFYATRRGRAVGALLPCSLPDLVEHFLGTRAIFVPERSALPHPWADTWMQMRRPLDPGCREFVDFSGSAAYSPLGYVPQVLGIWLGRVIGAPPLALLYLGRLLNGFVAVAAIAWALAMLPLGRGAALFVALLPMAQFEYASLSPDATVIAASFVLTAVALRAALAGCWTRSETAAGVIAAAVLSSVKIVYAPLALIGLGAVLRGRGAARSQLAVAGSAVAAALLWLLSARHSLSAYRDGVSPGGQIAFILHDPAAYLGILFKTCVVKAPFYIESAIGSLGWLTVSLPFACYALAICGFLVSPFARERSLPKTDITAIFLLWCIFLAAVCGVLVETALYIFWSPVGAAVVEGVQGRYFIPLLPLLSFSCCAFCVPRASSRISSAAYRFLAAATIVNSAGMYMAVADAFHIF